MKLKDRIAIVTGQSRGLGAAIAKAFRDEGAIVPKEPQGSKLDLLYPPSHIGYFIEDFIARHKAIDILVNNAAMLGPVGPLQDIKADDLGKTIECNLMGSIYVTQRCLPALLKSPRGKIINICGGGASTPLPRRLAYAVSKAGLARFSDTLAAELKDTSIDCNAVLPGALKTDMLDQIIEAGPERLGKTEFELHSSIREDQLNDTSAMDRAVALCVYLASEQSNGLTGKLISARHDPWQTWDIGEVMESESYLLRRFD